jgi:poly-gamma-glutamate capsule biosynthesis protein CapA/YwtB (metallophosphatase superfamily)
VLANLEGVLLPEVPGTLGPMDLAMPSALATGWLRQAGVTAVSLANNHARDLGASGYAETLAALADAGIAAAGPGEALDLGRLRVVALSDLGPSATGLRNLLGPDDLAALHAADPARPVLAFVHWGREYLPEPGPRQRALAEAMSRAGATLVIGAHAHRASAGIGLASGGDTALIASLGNFLFDQPADVASGAIAELRVFPQGTVFVRMFPIPNLYDAAAGLVPTAERLLVAVETGARLGGDRPPVLIVARLHVVEPDWLAVAHGPVGEADRHAEIVDRGGLRAQHQRDAGAADLPLPR